MYPLTFPSTVPCARRPPSLHRVPRVGSPASQVLCRRSDFPSPIPPRFVSFASAVPPHRPVLRHTWPGRPARADLGARYAASPCSRLVVISGGDDWIFQVPWRTPMFACPALRPRWNLHAKSWRLGTAFRYMNDVGFHSHSLSRLNHAACDLAIHASQHGSPRHHARLASAQWPTGTGRAGYLRGSSTRSFGLASLLHLPSATALPGPSC